MNKLIVIVVIVLGIINVGLFLFIGLPRLHPGADSVPSDWYAVSLVNGQLYFGHLRDVRADALLLDNVFALETLTVQPDASGSGEFQVQELPRQVYNLKRRGDNGVTVTDNAMTIDRHAVMFWEKLKPDTEVVKRLEKAQ